MPRIPNAYLKTGLGILAAVLATAPSLARAQVPPSSVISTSDIGGTASALAISVSELESGLRHAFTQSPEFLFIQAESKRLGIDVYLFGGTAAGLAHYVKWDLQRKQGDPRFQKERFDYDLTNIYRSTQDLDLVVDGSEAAAQEFQTRLREKFPHLQGSKDAWEVRLLRQTSGDKEALLGNPDFLKQHTDSNSTGLIKIEANPSSRLVYDLRQWNEREPEFLKDVLQGKLHYYFSPTHAESNRAKRGLNPPIFSAIRYLTKAFQYDLEILPEDATKVREIIEAFDPAKVAAMDPYAAKWIEKNGKKLYQHAVNLEYARRTLDEFGLREKLLKLPGDSAQIDTLAWWMSRLPLSEFKIGDLSRIQVGKSPGPTAAELGLHHVAHETKDFLAYESITRSHTGAPNVFESRTDSAGEMAAYGQGFYTAVGEQGARGTQFTIRFTVDPKAREGIDFSRVQGSHETGSYIVFHNKAALRVVPESISLHPVYYFHALAQNAELGTENKGVVEKFKRRFTSQLAILTADDVREIARIVSENLDQPDPSNALLRAWFDIPRSLRDLPVGQAIREKLERVLDQHIQTSEWHFPMGFIANVLSTPHSLELKSVVHTLAATEYFNLMTALAQHAFSGPQALELQDIMRLLIEKSYQGGRAGNANPLTFLAQYAFSQPHAVKMKELIALFIEKAGPKALKSLAMHTFSQPHASGMEDLIRRTIERAESETLLTVIGDVLSRPHAKKMTDLFRLILERGEPALLEQFASKVFSQPHTADMTDLIQIYIDKANQQNLNSLTHRVFAEEHSAQMKDLIRQVIERGDPTVLGSLARAFSRPHATGMYDLIEALVDRGNDQVDQDLASLVWSCNWNARSDGMENGILKVIERGNPDILSTFATWTFMKANNAVKMPRAFRRLIEKADVNVLQNLRIILFGGTLPGKEFDVFRNAVEIADPEERKNYLARHLPPDPDGAECLAKNLRR